VLTQVNAVIGVFGAAGSSAEVGNTFLNEASNSLAFYLGIYTAW
jgi:hypothetical protein